MTAASDVDVRAISVTQRLALVCAGSTHGGTKAYLLAVGLVSVVCSWMGGRLAREETCDKVPRLVSSGGLPVRYS
jgi:hypothetical protein